MDFFRNNKAKLDGMTEQQKRQAVAKAVAWELKKPSLAMRIAGRKAFANRNNIKGFDFAGSPITSEQIKSNLIKEMKAFQGAKYATPDNNDILTDVANEMEEFIHTNLPSIDMGFQLLFKLRDLRGSTHDHFDIINTNAGVSFTQRKPGEPIKLRKNITESKTTVNYLEFADGIGILDQWLQFNQWWAVEDVIEEHIKNYYDTMASTHYALLSALGAGATVDVAFDTDDATTLNKASATLLRAMRAAGKTVGENPQFYIVCAPEKQGRIETMLTAQKGSLIVAYGNQDQSVVPSIAGVISSTHITAADTGYYLVLPGMQLQRGVWMDMQTESDRNILLSAENIISRGQYNAAIGDSTQIRHVLYA